MICDQLNILITAAINIKEKEGNKETTDACAININVILVHIYPD